MPTAYAYARFSSLRQQRGTSLERQRRMVADWLAHHPEYILSTETFEDLGKSGWKGQHIKEGGGFAKLRAAVDAGAIESGSAILVEAIDRVGRLDTLAMLELLGPILRAGIDLITLDDGMVYNRKSLDGGQVFLLLGKIQAANQYSEALSRRLKASHASRRDKAQTAGITPKRLTPVWLTPDGTVIPEIATQVKTAFELYVSGVGKAVIAHRMRESGIPQLAKCSGPGVDGWLKNEAAIGKWHGVDVYPPIIDLSLFHRAQLHREKVRTSPPQRTGKHFLTGLVKCGSCGANYATQILKGEPSHMRCPNRQALTCTNKRVIPRVVLDEVYRLTSPKAAREAIVSQRVGVNETAIIAKEAEILAIGKQIADLADVVVATGPLPEFITRTVKAKAEREKAEGELAVLKATMVPAAVRSWREQGEIWSLERNDPQRFSAMLRGVGYSLTVNEDRTIVSSHRPVVYRFAGVDYKTGHYRLYIGDELWLIHKDPATEPPYFEPFDIYETVSSEWSEEAGEQEMENLRQLYQ